MHSLWFQSLRLEFEVHFSIEEVYSVTCVKDIRDVLRRYDVVFS